MDKIENIKQYIIDGIINHGPKVLYTVLVLVVGLWVIGLLTRLIRNGMTRKNVDPTLRGFLTSGFSILLKTLLIVTVITMLGVQTTSFIAILGAAGLGLGLALSGTLQNFAGGVMIMIFKPFKVGDFIDAQGHSGVVKEIQIFNTLLTSVDNKRIIIPNGGISTGSLVNYSAEDTRRVDMTFGIGYQDDIDKARKVISQIVASNQQILKTPEPFLGVIELGDSAVHIVVRVWTKTSDYWDVFFYMQETVKKTFDKEKITIPFPQTDVHLFKN